MATAARNRSCRPPRVTLVTRPTSRSTSSNSFFTGSNPDPPRRSSLRPPRPPRQLSRGRLGDSGAVEASGDAGTGVVSSSDIEKN